MAELATMTREAESGAAIDRGHLARMTFGDRSLEREVLQLFDRQSAMLIERIRAGSPATIASLAHTLKGSAAGIGAGAVTRSADAAELAAAGPAGECSMAIDRLAKAVDEARALIAELLREV
jgi:HPt (histidine-containing phosphotransfer) domain-containing protein